MLGIGFTEMLVIAAIALVVIGPEKFPDFAKIVVRTIRDLRGYVDDMKQDLSNELKPLKREMDSVNKLTRYDSESYLRSLTEDKPKPPPVGDDPVDRRERPMAGDFGYDESRDDAPNSDGPVGYGAYPGSEADTPPLHEQEGVPPTPVDSTASDSAPRPGAGDGDDAASQGDGFDTVRQPDRLD